MPTSRRRSATTDAPLVKAAIIYNICKFVEWPTTAANGGDFLIGTVAAQENGPDLATLAGKKIHGRTVRIVEIKDEAALASCQAVYLGRAGLDADTLSRLAGKPILTFTEATREGARPGAIDLTTDGARIRFSIHRGVSERAGLRLSSQLLKLALVRDGRLIAATCAASGRETGDDHAQVTSDPRRRRQPRQSGDPRGNARGQL